MRRMLCLMSLLAVVAGLTGCPRPAEFRFTSADPFSGAGWNALLDAGPPGLDLDGAEGDGGTMRDVVEPDVVRQDGNLLYVLNQYRGLMAVDLGSNKLRSTVATQGFPRDVYIRGGQAYVLVANAAAYQIVGNTVSVSLKSRLYVVDVSDPDEMQVLDQFDIEGDLVDSRLVGDVLYAVTSDYVWYAEDGGTVSKQQGSHSWVTSVNVADPDDVYEADALTFDGYGTVIHATPDAVLVAAPDYGTGGTAISYVDISDSGGALELRGTAQVKGAVADRFKFDLWNGVLRVVSSVFDQDRRVYVTTFDLTDPDLPAPMGETHLDDAVNETLFATRFDGARAYIVTYFTVDPLFVVDLSDPAHPEVSGMLEVPGWSTHIEPRGDMLIALGVDDTNGRRVSVSTFDVADPEAPALVDRVAFGGDWTWSNAYNDVKAFTTLDDTLIVPFSGWNSEQGGYDRLQFISMDQDGLLEARDYVDLQGTVQRSFAYSGAYYGVTTEQLVTIDGPDLGHLDVTGAVTLAEYIADQVTISPLLSAQVITGADAETVRVRTLGTLGPIETALDEVNVDLGTFQNAYVHGNNVILVGSTWSPSPHYRVARVDCSSPLNPTVSDLLAVDVTPFWDYWWWGPYPIAVDAFATAGAKFFVGDYWFPWDTSAHAFLLGDRLVLRCRSSHYDSVFGDTTAYQGLAVVDVAQMTWETTLGLGFDGISSIDAADGRLYIGSRQAVGFDWAHPKCAYFLRELDVAARTMGPSVNVPGQFVQYDPETEILLLRDSQWDSNTLAPALNSVRWDGVSPVEEIDSLTIPGGTVRVLSRGAKVFMDAYDGGYYLYTAALSGEGDLALSAGLLVSSGWGWLMDAERDSAYVAMEGGLMARYVFENGGELGEVTALMGTPVKLRFTNTTALAIGGYAGVAKLPLD